MNLKGLSKGTICLLAGILVLAAVPLWASVPNPTFIKGDVDGDGTKATSIGWSTAQFQTGVHSIHVTTSGAPTIDYAMVAVPTNFILDAGTTISYWGLTMVVSGVTAPDEIFLEFEDYTVIANTSPLGIPDGVTWVQWTLADAANWYDPNTMLPVDIASYYGKKVIYIGLGAGSPMSPSPGVMVDVYLDNLIVNGTTLLDDDTGTIEVRCGTILTYTGCTSIQDAIDAALSTTINVAAGTYTITSAINVNKGVTITGDVGTPANVVVQYNPPSTSLNGFEIGAANITIQGFTISDCFRGVHFGRTDITSTGCTITNCVFDNNSENAIGEVAAENTTISNNTVTNCNMGIEIRANEATSLANRTEVTGNTISSCSQSCIQTYLGKYVYIYGNTISNTNDKGINIIRSGATGTADRIQVIGNIISETKWPGIQVIGAPHTYVYNNTLTQCNYYGADGTGDWDYASIHVQDDIGPTYSHYTVIDNNTVYDGINGIQTWSDNVSITNNEIYDMGLTYADEKIVGSRTYKNSGILVGSNWGSGDYDPTGTVIQYNNIHDNYWGLFYSPNVKSGVIAEYNWWGHPTGPHHETNPGGLGDPVSDNVDFDPWLSDPVPVVLASFQAIAGQGFIALNWVTASEINCHRWEVHRGEREDGEYAKIDELSGHGSTETAHSYQFIDRQVTPEVTYYYKLKQVDFDGSSTWSHIVSATVSSAVPKTYALHQNYPNPFNPTTEIAYAISRDVHVTLKVYNILGAEVATLVDEEQAANLYTVSWNADGSASCVYFCRLQAGGFSKSIKMILLK